MRVSPGPYVSPLDADFVLSFSVLKDHFSDNISKTDREEALKGFRKAENGTFSGREILAFSLPLLRISSAAQITDRGLWLTHFQGAQGFNLSKHAYLSRLLGYRGCSKLLTCFLLCHREQGLQVGLPIRERRRSLAAGLDQPHVL